MSAASAVPSSSSHNGYKSTLSVLKELRADSTGFVDYYVKVFKQIVGMKRMSAFTGILDYPMQFMLWLVCVVIGSIFLNDCPAEPMLPVFLIVIGVLGSMIQIISQIAGSLPDSNLDLINDIGTLIVMFFLLASFIGGVTILVCWFITGCVWVFSMPMPSMTPIPEIVTTIIDLMTSPSTSTLKIDQLAAMNDTMAALLISPEKYCAFPVYGLVIDCTIAVWMVIYHLVIATGLIVIVTVTALVLYLLPSEVENVSNVEQLQMSDV